MLLQSHFVVAPNYVYQHSDRDPEEPANQWQEFLHSQVSRHPLFRRKQISLLGGKGSVVLTGRVSSYYEKQLAQEFVRRMDGVEHIDNRIEVAYPTACGSIQD